MSNITVNGASVRTMTSREIAELTGKEHKNVLADIRKMFEELGLTSADFSADLPDAYGRLQPAFRLPKRECLILVSGYSVQMRARIIDRWQELEARTSPALPDFSSTATAPAASPALPSVRELALMVIASEDAKEKAEAERDEAIRTKALIGSKREAAALRVELGACSRHATITAVKNATGDDYDSLPMRYDFLPMRRWCKANGATPTDVPDKRYGTVKAWPAAAWAICHGVDLAELFGGGA